MRLRRIAGRVTVVIAIALALATVTVAAKMLYPGLLYLSADLSHPDPTLTGAPPAQLVIDCPEAVQISGSAAPGYPAYTAGDTWHAPGTVVDYVLTPWVSARVFGGPWQEARLEATDPMTLDGAACPQVPEDASEGWLKARTSLLDDAEILDFAVEPSTTLEEAARGSEVTTFVLKFIPELTNSWANDYAMASLKLRPSQGPPPVDLEDLGLGPGTDWVWSNTFDSRISVGALATDAWVNVDSGIVVVRVWEPERHS